MCVLARACGHSKLADFENRDLITWDYDMHRLSGVRFGGVTAGEDDVQELRSLVEKLTVALEKTGCF